MRVGCFTKRRTQQVSGVSTSIFIKKHEWPPQSPDCNPMDYAIWDRLEGDVYRDWADKFIGQELKDAIVQSWEQITLEQIPSYLSSWKKRLGLVCQADGGHIENLL